MIEYLNWTMHLPTPELNARCAAVTLLLLLHKNAQGTTSSASAHKQVLEGCMQCRETCTTPDRARARGRSPVPGTEGQMHPCQDTHK